MSADAAGVGAVLSVVARYLEAHAAHDAQLRTGTAAEVKAALDAALEANHALDGLDPAHLRALAAQAEAGDESCPAGYCHREDSPRLGSLPVNQEAREAMRAERRAARAALAAAEEVGK